MKKVPRFQCYLDGDLRQVVRVPQARGDVELEISAEFDHRVSETDVFQVVLEMP